MAVGARRRIGQRAGIAVLDGGDRVSSALQRLAGQFTGMGIAYGFARHRAQAKALIG